MQPCTCTHHIPSTASVIYFDLQCGHSVSNTFEIWIFFKFDTYSQRMDGCASIIAMSTASETVVQGKAVWRRRPTSCHQLSPAGGQPVQW